MDNIEINRHLVQNLLKLLQNQTFVEIYIRVANVVAAQEDL